MHGIAGGGGSVIRRRRPAGKRQQRARRRRAGDLRKYRVICHAAKPSHASFQEAPKNITQETVDDLKKSAATIYAQTVQTKAMPLGNQTNMTDEELATLGRWLKALP
jgi:uncharacterized membrane protein